ncbi:MAG TPA: c-type cytochrome [Candidatus Methylomirabilis sp.]|nr:c-type cytochrome [Candidatus Methylomirabilis sp.]
MRIPWRRIAAVLVLAGLLGCGETPPQQQPSRGSKTRGGTQGPIRITDEELHRHGGTPPGWKFTVPDGDPEAGRAVFIELECYSCHQVNGEKFPGSATERQTGPDLTGVGDEHPAEYFAEAILNPNAVIIAEPGYTGQDGLSIMPSYTDLLTLKEWVDLVAYLKSLNGGSPHPGEGQR